MPWNAQPFDGSISSGGSKEAMEWMEIAWEGYPCSARAPWSEHGEGEAGYLATLSFAPVVPTSLE